MQSIMRNAGLEETQAGIKTARRNINNLRYAEDMFRRCPLGLLRTSQGVEISLLSPRWSELPDETQSEWGGTEKANFSGAVS